MNRLRLGLIVIAIGITGNTTLFGQSVNGVGEGGRIRFSIVTQPPGTYFIGDIVRIGSDSLAVAVVNESMESDSVISVPLNLVDYVAIPAGIKNRAILGTTVGAAVGILSGAAVGYSAGDTRECELVTSMQGVLPLGPCTGSSAEKKGLIGGLIGVAAGTALGFGVGSFIKAPTWEESWINGMRVAIDPTSCRGLQLMVTFAM